MVALFPERPCGRSLPCPRQVRHYGLCNFGTEDLAAFAAAGGKPVSNQLPYNLLYRAIESGALPACIDEGALSFVTTMCSS